MAAELHHVFSYIAHAKGVGGISVELVDDGAAVDAQDVTILENLVLVREAMDNFFIPAYQQGGRATVEALEAGHRTVVPDKLLGEGVDLLARQAGAEHLPDLRQGLSDQEARHAAAFDFLRSLEYHLAVLSAHVFV